MLPIKRVVVCGGVDEPPLTPRRRVGANQESRRTGCEAPREGYLTQTVQTVQRVTECKSSCNR